MKKSKTICFLCSIILIFSSCQTKPADSSSSTSEPTSSPASSKITDASSAHSSVSQSSLAVHQSFALGKSSQISYPSIATSDHFLFQNIFDKTVQYQAEDLSKQTTVYQTEDGYGQHPSFNVIDHMVYFTETTGDSRTEEGNHFFISELYPERRQILDITPYGGGDFTLFDQQYALIQKPIVRQSFFSLILLDFQTGEPLLEIEHVWYYTYDSTYIYYQLSSENDLYRLGTDTLYRIPIDSPSETEQMPLHIKASLLDCADGTIYFSSRYIDDSPGLYSAKWNNEEKYLLDDSNYSSIIPYNGSFLVKKMHDIGQSETGPTLCLVKEDGSEQVLAENIESFTVLDEQIYYIPVGESVYRPLDI